MTTNKSYIAVASLTALGCIAARPAAAQFTSQNFTGDSTSGISASKTYTAAVDFDSSGGNRTINGVTFFADTGGSQVDTIRGETVNLIIPNNTGSGFTGNTATSAAGGHNNLTAGGVHDLDSDFFFDNGSQGNQTESLTISNLAVGTAYKATFYNVAFGNAGLRVINVGDSLGHTLAYDENQAGDGNGNLLMDSYTATASTMTFTFQTTQTGNSFHQYGFTNELVSVGTAAAEPGSIALLALSGLPVIGRIVRRRRSA